MQLSMRGHIWIIPGKMEEQEDCWSPGKRFLFFESIILTLFSTAHYLRLFKELQLHQLATRVSDTGVQKDILEPRVLLALGSSVINEGLKWKHVTAARSSDVGVDACASCWCMLLKCYKTSTLCMIQ